jgi:hypothetical protein
MASREASGLLPFVRRRGAWSDAGSLPEHFAGGVVNRVAGLPAVLVVGIDDLVSHGIVRPELGFLRELSGGVILIEGNNILDSPYV